MQGMTTQERLDDICKRSGLSEEIVRRVQRAEKESIIESLMKGERATLMGRATLRPMIRSRLGLNAKLIKFIKVKAEVSSSIEAELEKYGEFQIDDDIEEEDDTGIRLKQIGSLI